MSGKYAQSLVPLLLASLLCGCAGMGERTANSKRGREERAYFTQNRANARMVEGKGYVVQGLSGYYDYNGRKLEESDGQEQKHLVAQVNYQENLPAPAPSTGVLSPPNQPYQPNQPNNYPQEVIAAPQPNMAGQSLSQQPLQGTSIPQADAPEGIEKLYPANMQKAFMKSIGRGPDERIARDEFNQGEALFRRAAEEKDEKKRREGFKEATKHFKKAINRWPDSSLEEDAMLMLAESQFFADRYAWADDAYGMLLKKYTNSRYLDKAVARQFAIGRYWEAEHARDPHWPVTPNFFDRSRPFFDTHGHALKAYDEVRLNDPRGPLADDSIMAAANMHFIRGRYEDADYYYGLIRKEYSKSEHQVQAHLLALQCKMRKYQGAGYTGAPLEEAEELIKQMNLQFPNELANERPYLTKCLKEVRAQRATRDMELAQYYEKNKFYRAAKFHYSEVAKEFPGTPFAEAANERVAALQGQPDTPPNRIAWITDKLDREKQKDTAREKAAIAARNNPTTAPSATIRR